MQQFNQNYEKIGEKEPLDQPNLTHEMVQLTSIKQMKNIYDQGLYNNTMQVLFPKRMD